VGGGAAGWCNLGKGYAGRGSVIDSERRVRERSDGTTPHVADAHDQASERATGVRAQRAR
jgi:hypothetical protein